MLSPDYLFGCTDRIVEIYEQLQSFAVNDICRRIAKANYITPTAEWQVWQGQQAGLHVEEIQKEIQRVTGMSQTEIKRLFEDSGTKSLNFDDSIYKRAGLSPLPIAQSPSMLAVLQATFHQTNGELTNFTQSIAKASQKTFFASSDSAYMEISSGLSDSVSAISRAVKTTAASGIQVIDYNSGARISVEAGVRRAVLTGVNQGAAKLTEARAGEMDSDLVEVTSHADARPEHAVWQGGIYSLSGNSKEYGSLVDITGYGDGDGLCGWNCRHSFYPYIEGVSEPSMPQYSKERTDKAYDLTQTQRAAERNIRTTKRGLNALDTANRAIPDASVSNQLTESYQKQALKLKNQRLNYEKFCKDNGLKTQAERTQIPDFGRSQASKATAAAKAAANK